jgi:hypothetical protein
LVASQVLDTFSVERAYIMFRTLGLRHLVIVNSVNHVVGLIARKVCGACICLFLPEKAPLAAATHSPATCALVVAEALVKPSLSGPLL